MSSLIRIKSTFFFALILFCSLLQADIKSDLAQGLDLKNVVANASAHNEFPDEIVKVLIQNKVDPGEATKAVIEAFPSYIHTTSITRAAIVEAPFSAPSIVGAAIKAASQFENDITKIAVQTAPTQSAAIKQEAVKATPPFVNLTTVSEQAKKEPVKTQRQIQQNADLGLAGVVLATRGEVVAINEKGEARGLIRRSKFFTKDTIKTGPDASAQLRFEDRAVMGLRQNSELNIKKYRFAGNRDNSNSAVMELVSGGFRTISGTIGKSNRDAYSMSTPAATIGIRGTDYDVIISPDGKVVAAVWEGGISIANGFGDITIGSGSGYTFATISRDSVPTGTNKLPKEFIGQNGSATSLNAKQKKKLIKELKDEEISDEIKEFLEDQEEVIDEELEEEAKAEEVDIKVETEPEVDSPS
jgi:hypothetical protein